MAADAALMFFFGLWALLGRGSSSSSSSRSTWPETAPPTPNSAPPWPAVLPPSLPPFPGQGWEYDEPPPPAVVARARQLVDTLWARGSGASKVEQTAGRWIAYQAQIVASGKKGVVAYRQKGTAALPPSPPIASRPAAPAAPAATPVANRPGVPAAAPNAPQRTVTLVVGRTYRMLARVVRSDPPIANEMLEPMKRGLEAGGAYDVAIDRGPPLQLAYSLQATRPVVVNIGAEQTLTFGALTITLVLLGVDDQTLPAPAPAAPAPSPLTLPVLRYGDGLKPQAPNPNVMLLQRRLRIDADGRFGEKTRTAVIEFQRRTGLAPNESNAKLLARGFGVVKQATWTKLFATTQA